MVSKSVIVLLALVAVAAAVENPVKRQILLHAAPLPLARAIIPPVRPLVDDGSWVPGKYDPIEVAAPVAPVVAAPYAHLASYAPLAPVARLGLPLAHYIGDDGSYWAGKYGPEWQ